VKKMIRALIEATGFSIFRLPPTGGSASVYHQDGLISIHNHDFMGDVDFRRAYGRGVQATAGDDYNWHWRVHVGLWAARTAALLPGDFVECGVNRGALSSAIMEYLGWNNLQRTFWLMDTFEGIDERFITEEERNRDKLAESSGKLASGVYTADFAGVQANFAEWRNVSFVKGSIPDTLPEVSADSIAFLHIDMNCAPPEIAALKYFWDRITPGGLVLLDDYAYLGFEPQKEAMDELARELGVVILSLPTGQGLILKPA
jgi:Macrocin-O-methyltransferase (TylF)